MECGLKIAINHKFMMYNEKFNVSIIVYLHNDRWYGYEVIVLNDIFSYIDQRLFFLFVCLQ